jgi:hypothetical protein
MPVTWNNVANIPVSEFFIGELVYSLSLSFTASQTPANRNWTPTPRNSPESNTSLDGDSPYIRGLQIGKRGGSSLNGGRKQKMENFFCLITGMPL